MQCVNNGLGSDLEFAVFSRSDPLVSESQLSTMADATGGVRA